MLRRFFIYFFIPLICCYAQNHKLPPSITEVDVQELSSLQSHPNYYVPSSKEGYVLAGSGVLLGGTVAIAGFLYILPSSFTNWDKNLIFSIEKRYVRNVRQAPVVDRDDLFLNWVTHPYWGAIYYMQPRIAGYSWAESFVYSAFASTFFWEYGIEAFAEVPSWQDLVITPAIGSMVGEIFYHTTRYIQANNNEFFGSRLLGNVALGVMDPISLVLQKGGLAETLGIYNKNQPISTFVPNGQGGVSLVFLMQF
ncbi:hypothetical protein CCZ01_00520 [Helicobacter monodelphidis]|uniref:DUF3943 domain-containing protein n=1 Tax=Helicobacter sp. 15-1451 TaxID=2004995 RepID=UPI000DCC4193|nr:DUF3943 domain-containing protein [Helicobacter sp. 15-1451]RAX59259.1 hypothetical protein CCZ01_00520 [Helicobacter sp. 15-1451]